MRYMNPGFKNCFSVINSSDLLTEETDTTKTKTDVAFQNTSFKNCILLDFPASGEIFCKFDFYNAGDIFCGEVSNTKRYNMLRFYVTRNGSATFSDYTNGASSAKISQIPEVGAGLWGLKEGEVNSALFHLKWADSANGYFEFQVNDYYFGKSERADLIPYSTAQLLFTIYTGSDTPISNVIISDEPISIKEQIISLPITSINSDMTFDSETGIYTASSVNQSLLANVDVAYLTNNFGGNSEVTGVAMVGNPAYRTTESLNSLTAISKKNNSVTTYGTVNVPTDSNSVVAHSFKVSDTTIADLQNMQFGWKVGG